MKQEIPYTRRIWVDDRGRYENVNFVIEVDLEDLPYKMFTKAVYAKNGKSSIAGGAITVRLKK